MATQEFYIRGPNDTDARGPFTVEQLVTLGETGGIDLETLFYDAESEQWAVIGSNADLRGQVFPEKKKLTFKPKEAVTSLNVAQPDQRPVTVEQFLAAAEGRTEDTKERRAFLVARDRSAQIGLYADTLIFLASAATFILPHIDTVLALDYMKALHHPLIFLGLADLVCAVLLGLGMAAIYPFVRFRAAFGMGFLVLLFLLQDQPTLALSAAAASFGMYFCTVFLSYFSIGFAVLLGLGGIGSLAYALLT
jgi:hypothetical protein